MLPSTLRASRASALRVFARAPQPIQRSSPSLAFFSSPSSPSFASSSSTSLALCRAVIGSRAGLKLESFQAANSRAFSSSSTAGAAITEHPDNNVSPGIAARIGTNLHLKEHHPLNNIKHIIETHFNELSAATGQRPFKVWQFACSSYSLFACCRARLCPGPIFW